MTETYNIYRDDVKVAEGLTAHSFEDTGLSPATTYKYKVEAVSGDLSVMSDEITVTTLPIAVTGVTMDKATADVAVGGTVKLTPTVTPANATDKSGAWSSSDTAVATVSGGTVTVKAAATVGATTTVTFTTKDGSKKATCVVTVIAAEEG